MCFFKEFIIWCVHVIWYLKGLTLKHFFYHIERRGVNWGLLYKHLPPWRKRCVCIFSFNHLTFNKVKSWWPKVSQIFFCVQIKKLLWMYYVHKQSLSNLNISNTTLWRHQMPYMNIVNKNTTRMKLNLENTTSHRRTFLTIKGHQTNNWKQIRNSVQDAFAEYQKNECLIYCMFCVSHLCLESWLHPRECGDVSKCCTWMMTKEFLKAFWSLNIF
jgi:hypothetical protein